MLLLIARASEVQYLNDLFVHLIDENKRELLEVRIRCEEIHIEEPEKRRLNYHF